jgi:ABC-type lipoprotein release transport system permease subunit
MFSYASKRITRSRSLFLALFLSVVLAATLFSGILQGADAVGGSMISGTLNATKYDIISTVSEEKNVTRTNIYDINSFFKSVDGVESVDHFLREEIDLNSTIMNTTLATTIVAVPPSSELAKRINAPNGLEDGKIYIDLGSANVTKFSPGLTISMGLLTYAPYGTILDIQEQYFPIQVGSTITLDDQTWSLFTGTSDGKSNYAYWVSAALSGNDGIGGRPQYNLVVVTENTYKAILNQLYFSSPKVSLRRAPTRIWSVACIRLDRGALINQWDIPGSLDRLQKIGEQLNAKGSTYSYVPRNYLQDVLTQVSSNSDNTKLNTLIITIPVFFTAWYLGMTVSDVAMGLRRKEIGLLLTRGMTYRQVFLTLLSEALLIGVAAGVLGLVLGAIVLPFAIGGADFTLIFRYVTPTTFAATLAFSLALSTLAAYNPARKATQIEIVDALREYREEEDTLGGWAEPLIAFLLGLYKLIFLVLGLDISSLSPASGNFITTFLYQIFYGTNYLLDFVWTILLFWGFTKLFLMYAPQFQNLLGGLASRLTGEAGRFTSLSSGRNLKRAGAYTFMIALIISYSFVVIGNAAMTNDYTSRYIAAGTGADASIIVYSRSAASDQVKQIRAMNGVESAAIEMSFDADTNLGAIPIRAIEVDQWNSTAYTNELYVSENTYALFASKNNVVTNQFGVIEGGSALLERGAAQYFGIGSTGTGSVIIQVHRRPFTLNVVGLFGRDLGDNWVPQNPTIYVPLDMIKNFDDTWITSIRIIVKFKPGVDIQAFTSQVKALGPNIQRVDITSENILKAQSSPLISGSMQVIQLGIIFAAAVSSVGVALVVYTLLRSRSKELNLMSIKGYSARQLSLSLITENVGLAVFAAVLGAVIGLVSLSGQVVLYNRLVYTYTSWRLILPVISQLQLALLFIIILAATAAPIVLVVRRITDEPNVRGEA